VDTAGVRNTHDVVERLGIERAMHAVEEADHIIVLLDASLPLMPNLPPIDRSRMSIVINKTDLLDKADVEALIGTHKADLAVSALTGEGMDELRQHLLLLAGHDQHVEGVYSARQRHISAIEQSLKSTRAALQKLTINTMPELAAEELRIAQQALQMITGRFDSEDLLGEIFSSFCIGK
jgi:tRNA modification GTPase